MQVFHAFCDPDSDVSKSRFQAWNRGATAVASVAPKAEQVSHGGPFRLFFLPVVEHIEEGAVQDIEDYKVTSFLKIGILNVPTRKPP